MIARLFINNYKKGEKIRKKRSFFYKTQKKMIEMDRFKPNKYYISPVLHDKN